MMETQNPINIQALKKLRGARRYLTPQQYRTIRGQILAGDLGGAEKGLNRLLKGTGRLDVTAE
jgi:hypothetical protein